MLNFFKKFVGDTKKQKYTIMEFREGMARAFGSGMECGYVNCNKELTIMLTDEDGAIIFAGIDDINWDDNIVKEYSNSIRELRSEYYFGGGNYQNGVALVMWTILPDGRYFADEDGFGGEDNDEINIYCFIDKQGKVIIPFQSMKEEQIEEFREKAEEIAAGKVQS